MSGWAIVPPSRAVGTHSDTGRSNRTGPALSASAIQRSTGAKPADAVRGARVVAREPIEWTPAELVDGAGLGSELDGAGHEEVLSQCRHARPEPGPRGPRVEDRVASLAGRGVDHVDGARRGQQARSPRRTDDEGGPAESMASPKRSFGAPRIVAQAPHHGARIGIEQRRFAPVRRTTACR